MRTRTIYSSAAFALLASLLPIPAAAVTINIFESSVPIVRYELQGKEFSTYPRKYVYSAGVDCGCGPLTFHAIVFLSGSNAKHTFAVSLKRDGLPIEGGTTSFGPGFFENNVEITFDQTAMVPGKWSVEWDFDTDSHQHGSQSIVLLAPVMTVPQPYTQTAENQHFCNRNSSTQAVYLTGVCFYRHIPAGGFIAQNGFYVPPSPIPSCPIGTYDTVHCFIGRIPAGTHVVLYAGRYYYDHFPTGPHCPLPASSDDNAHCLITPPPGIGVVEFNGGLFFKPTLACNFGTYDGAHCFLGMLPAGTHVVLYAGRYYYDHFPAGAHCPLPASSDDTAHCLISPPPGVGVVEFQGGLFLDVAQTCPIGTHDATGCLLGRAPSGTTAFALAYPMGSQPTDWDWSPRFCP